MIDIFHELEDTGWCPFANTSGKPCLLCGGTRAIVSLANFDLSTAIQMNFFVVLLFGLCVVVSPVWLPRLIGAIQRRRLSEFLEAAAFRGRYFLGSALLLGWSWNVVRWF